MKTERLLLKIMGIALLFSFLFLLIGVPVVNDLTAIRVKKELCALPLPDQTKRLDAVVKAGKLVGNGNGMQYFGAMLIKSDLSEQELVAYYRQFSKNEWSCLVERQTTKSIDMIELTTVSFRVSPDSGSFYRVYTWGDSRFVLRDWDLRGH